MKKRIFMSRFQLFMVSIIAIFVLTGFHISIAPEYTYTEKLISSDSGGVIQVADRCVLVFPADALDTDTVITMEVFTSDDFINDDKIDIIFNFGPSPLQFSNDVQMILPWDDYYEGPGDTVKLYFYNEVRKKWELQDAEIVDVPGKRIVNFALSHFSRYALAGPSVAY